MATCNFLNMRNENLFTGNHHFYGTSKEIYRLNYKFEIDDTEKKLEAKIKHFRNGESIETIYDIVIERKGEVVERSENYSNINLQPYIKNHDILRLEGRVTKKDGSIENIQKDLEMLKRYERKDGIDIPSVLYRRIHSNEFKVPLRNKEASTEEENFPYLFSKEKMNLFCDLIYREERVNSVPEMARVFRNYESLDRESEYWISENVYICKKGGAIDILVSDLLQNDKSKIEEGIYSYKKDFEFLGIRSLFGGRTSFNVFNEEIIGINFEAFLEQQVEGAAGFQYKVKNKKTGKIWNVKVYVITKERTPIILMGKSGVLTQGTTITFTEEALLFGANVLYGPIHIIGIESEINCRVTRDGDSFIVKSTGTCLEKASFVFKVVDSKGNLEKTKTNLTVLELPLMEAYARNTHEIEEIKKSFVPPSLKDIFDNWPRFCHKDYYPEGVAPQGEAANWKFENGQFKCTINSSQFTGMISPNKYRDYTLKASLEAIGDRDDDLIALVLAFKREKDTNKLILACRSPNGHDVAYKGKRCSFFMYSLNMSPRGLVKEVIAGNPNDTISNEPRTVLPGTNDHKTYWANMSPTRLEVQRIGNVFKVKDSPFKSETIYEPSELVFDCNSRDDTKWACDECSYGYCCLSQKNSTFFNVDFDGGVKMDTLFDIEKNEIWEYKNNEWIKSSKNIQEVIGYPRDLKDIENGIVYRVEENRIYVKG